MERVINLNHQYLRVIIEQMSEQGMEGYRSRVLQQNRIKGLLEMDKRYLDNVCYYYYDVTSMNSLENLMAQGTITSGRLNQMFEILGETLEHMNSYLMKQEDLCLRPECMLEKEETGDWFFLYLPEYQGNQRQDVEHLAEFMLQHVEGLEEETVENLYRFYSDVIQAGEELSVGGLVKLWNRAFQKQEQEILEVEPKRELICAEPAFVYTGEKFFSDDQDGRRKRGRIYQVPYREKDFSVNDN